MPQTKFAALVQAGVTFVQPPTRTPWGMQAQFHDHILRNNAEYEGIAAYIANNPRNWKTDRHYRKD